MADDHFALPDGHRLDEYEIRGVLGAGPSGITYAGFDHDRAKPVVIKECLPDRLSSRTDTGVVPKSPAHSADFAAELHRFLDGGQALARIAHPNLVNVLRCLRANGTGYIIRDHVDGVVLSALLERQPMLPEADCKRFVLPVLDGLEALHRNNFLHRDIGPDQIVIGQNGSPVLLGFPSQRRVTAARKAFGAGSIGPSNVLRPGYAALEQYSRMGHLGAWTDIYSLGAVIYRCATGLTPPEATKRATADEMLAASEATRQPYDARTLAGIDAALAVHPHERPQSVETWRRSFAVALDPIPRAPLGARHTARGARGQMFIAAQPPEPVRAAPASRGGHSPAVATVSEPQRQWTVPTIAATVLITALTWVDTGILRSSGAENDAADALAPQRSAGQTAPHATPPATTRTSGETRTGGGVYGTLTLELTPDDAEATLPDLGRAYETGMRIPAGRHTVRVSRDGYEPETRTIEVAGDTRSSISLDRKSLQGPR